MIPFPYFFNRLMVILLVFSALNTILVSATVGPVPDTDEVNPSWSPDGQEILFTSYGAMSDGLFLIKPDGSGLQKISGGWDASWSPDGIKIIMMVNFYNGTDPRSGSYEIAILDLKTQNRTRLTYNGIKEGAPKYSPDGKKIVFEATDQTGDSDIYTFDINTNMQNKITHGESAHFPEFSPDSKWITYLSYSDRFFHIITIDGKKNRKLINKDKYDLSSNYRWYSDSKHLIFSNRTNTIMKVDINDPTDIEFLHDPAAHWNPKYSPDGNFITFVSDMDGGNPDLFVALSNGSDLYRLVYNTNPRVPNPPEYFSKISRQAPPPWPWATPEQIPKTPVAPSFSLFAAFASLTALVLIKRIKK